jgi:hypothetical protein
MNTSKNGINEEKADRLPKKSESWIAHVRPHGMNKKDVDETPSGKWEVKKCFWLNASYIKEVIVDHLA